MEDGLGNAKAELVVKYSQQFKEELVKHFVNGYKPSSAKINFKVYWRKPDTEMEVLIILPELCLVKAFVV